MLGCGYDSRFRGGCNIKNADDHDLRGVCPGWWRSQPFILDVIRLRKWRENLGHPNDIPARLLDAIDWLDMYENEAERRMIEEQKNVSQRR